MRIVAAILLLISGSSILASCSTDDEGGWCATDEMEARRAASLEK